MTYYAGTAFASVTNFGEADGYAEDFTFESGKTYHFTVTCENVYIEAYGMSMPTEIVTLEVYDTPCDHAKLSYVEAKDPTCTENGNLAHWYCDDCDKYFADGEAAEEITDPDSLVITAIGHLWEDATCTEPKTCAKCGATEGEALGHETILRGAKAATCTEEGYTGDLYCTVCGELVRAGEKIPALGHSFQDGYCVHCGVKNAEVPNTGDASMPWCWDPCAWISTVWASARTIPCPNPRPTSSWAFSKRRSSG